MRNNVSSRNLLLWFLGVVLVCVAWATRYETIGLGEQTAYQVNRWTGTTRLLLRDTSREVRRQKLVKGSLTDRYVDE